MEENTKMKKTWLDRFLITVERVCNRLPQPAILFCWLFLFTAIIGAVVTAAGISIVNPANGEMVVSQNFFSKAGILWFLDNMVKNFVGFAPLGLVISMTLGIGLCEESGLVMSLLKSGLRNVPPALVPYLIAFVGTIGNIASDTANVIIPPIAALLYMGVGRHPIVGMICGYAGANAGFTANLLVGGTDTLLQGLTNEAIKGFLPDTAFEVNVTCNWYFMIASTFLCSFVIGGMCTKFIEPRFGKYEGESTESLEKTTPEQARGLRFAGITAAAYLILLAVGFYSGLLSGENGGFLDSPLLKGLIPILFVFFAICGIAYGVGAGTFKNSTDVSKAMTRQMAAMGSYVCFCFFCGQFQGLFNWTKLGTLLAIGGADLLESAGFKGIPLFVFFILVVTFVNIFMSSGSAKWAIFAPIFVPMFMLLGVHPAFTQLLYRLGDSPTNAVTPMSAYLWMMLSIAQNKYDKNLKVGTLISNLLPIAIVLEIVWIIFMIIWYMAGIPIGPGTGLTLPAGIM